VIKKICHRIFGLSVKINSADIFTKPLSKIPSALTSVIQVTIFEEVSRKNSRSISCFHPPTEWQLQLRFMTIWKYPPQLQYKFGYENHTVSCHATPFKMLLDWTADIFLSMLLQSCTVSFYTTRRIKLQFCTVFFYTTRRIKLQSCTVFFYTTRRIKLQSCTVSFYTTRRIKLQSCTVSFYTTRRIKLQSYTVFFCTTRRSSCSPVLSSFIRLEGSSCSPVLSPFIRLEGSSCSPVLSSFIRLEDQVVVLYCLLLYD